MTKLLFYSVLFLFNLCIGMAQSSDIIQTPSERFNDLPSYDFAPHYLEVEPNLNIHYVDEGNQDDPVVLLLHGEPTWSFTYRKIIPVLVENGYRVIAPDLIGFGKSDKYTDYEKYTYSNHTKWLVSFIQELDLKKIYLFAHDWGGMIALRIVAEQPELFSRVIISYAFLFTGEETVPESFVEWKNYARNDSSLQAGQVMDWGTNTKLSNQIKDAYNAPFPNETYITAVRKFPAMIPTDAGQEEAKINLKLREKLKEFDKPFLTIWGNHEDPMWQGKEKILQQEIPGAIHQDHFVLDSNHFIQEDQPEALTEIILNFFE